MSTADPVRELAHDHAEINRRVLEVGALLGGRRAERDPALAVMLADLREQLFLHFAREEEGLFPFVTAQVPDLAHSVDTMAVAHDTICGALARMCHMASSEAAADVLGRLFERFESAYAAHAAAEAELLRNLAGRLDADQRTQLAALVRGL